MGAVFARAAPQIVDMLNHSLYVARFKLIRFFICRLAPCGTGPGIGEHFVPQFFVIGPEAGDKGGYVVFEGTPAELKKCKESYTGRFLAMNTARKADPVTQAVADKPSKSRPAKQSSSSAPAQAQHKSRSGK